MPWLPVPSQASPCGMALELGSQLCPKNPMPAGGRKVVLVWILVPGGRQRLCVPALRPPCDSDIRVVTAAAAPAGP